MFSTKVNPHDRVKTGVAEQTEIAANQTGFERLKTLFVTTKENDLHPSMVNIFHTSLGTFLIGGIYGGVVTSRGTFITFIENNEATTFRNHLDAKRILMDKMFTSFAKGFTRNGLKIAFFCTTLVATYEVLSLYRNKDSVWHYTIAGSTAGSLYKFPLGPKGMVAGAFFGGFFGSLYGGYKFLMMKLLSFTEDNFRQLEVDRMERREEKIRNFYKDIRGYRDEKNLLEAMNEIGPNK